MGRLDIEEREKEYLAAAREVDTLEAETAELWLLHRTRAKSDQAASHMVTSDIHPYWNELKAKLHIAKLRLEAAYAEGKERE